MALRGGDVEEDDYDGVEDDDDTDGATEAEGKLEGEGVAWLTAKLEQAAAALGKSSGLEKASRRARLEQRVEDYNALQKSAGTFHRAVLVLPLTPEFDPPRGQPGHGRVQFSDRVSASRSVGAELTRRGLEVPWHFKLEPLASVDDEELVEALGFEGVRPERQLGKDPLNKPVRARPGDALGSGRGLGPRLKQAFCSPLDFRAPENFLFAPLWMLRALRAKPYDVCFLTWVKLNDGVTIELQPHQDAFLKLANPRSVLEEELKYYSSATRGSTISLLYEDTQYDFDVTDCVGKDGTQLESYNPERCAGVAIQDADVSLDLAAHGLDKPPQKQRVAADGDEDEDKEEDEVEST